MMYGSSASSRARFTSRAASACWRRDRPVIARERILPRSDRKRFSTSMFVYVISLSAIWIRLRFFGLPVARFERCLIAAKNVPPEDFGRRILRAARGKRSGSAGGCPAARQRGRVGQPHVPDHAAALEEADEPRRQVELAAEQAVAGARRERVVVVVPALAERQERDREVVPALVPGREVARAEPVADGVDRPRRVLEQEHAQDAAPQQRL